MYKEWAENSSFPCGTDLKIRREGKRYFILVTIIINKILEDVNLFYNVISRIRLKALLYFWWMDALIWFFSYFNSNIFCWIVMFCLSFLQIFRFRLGIFEVLKLEMKSNISCIINKRCVAWLKYILKFLHDLFNLYLINAHSCLKW